jgi:putative peptidoglycan lipid II flippase
VSIPPEIGQPCHGQGDATRVVRSHYSMSSSLARSAGLISIATLTSRILGVVRESVLAHYFGASMQMDAYNVAFRVPNLLRDLFAEGAMTAAFVPAFTRTLSERGREHAWQLGNLVMNTLVIITGGLVVLGIVFAEPITRAIVAAEFVSIPGKLDLTVTLTRIMLPFLTLVAVAVAMMGMLNSLRQFFVPSLSPAMFNVATIACVVTLVPLMSRLGLPPIMAIALGTLLGGIGQIVLQWPALRREGFRYRPILDFRDPELRQVLRMMGPGTLGVAAVNINVLVNTWLATSDEGAVSWLGYAFRLMYLPIGVFGVSIATAALPEVSTHAVADDLVSMRRTVSHALRLMLMLNVPAMVGLMVLADPIVALLYERGRFGPSDTTATAAALVFYAPGLLGYSIVKIASPTFYSLRDSRTPATVSVMSVGVNLALNLTLVTFLGYRGLALGTAIAALFNAIVLLWLLRGRLGGLDSRRLVIALAKITGASAVMGLVAAMTLRWLIDVVPGTGELVKAIRVFTAIAVAVVALTVSARLLRIDEFNEAIRRIIRRISPGQR